MAQEPSQETFFVRLSGSLNRLSEVILFVSILLMTLLTLLQITSRLFFQALTWSEEVTCFLLVIASFSGIVVGVHKGAHIAMTFVVDHLSGSAKRAMLYFSNLIGLLFFSVVGWYGAILAWQERAQYAASVEVPMGLIYLVFPLSSAIAIIHIIASTQTLMRGER